MTIIFGQNVILNGFITKSIKINSLLIINKRLNSMFLLFMGHFDAVV